MPASSKLYVSMLGGCSLTCDGKTVNDHSVRSKKIWMLLEYLVTFRNREISQNELFDLLYPDDKSENPGNALKTLMHRIRGMLDELDYIPSKDMIIQRRGTYSWNSAMDFEVDVDVFESLCDKGNLPEINDEKKLASLWNAIEMYNGDFLPKSALEPWVIPLNTYYHTMFIKAVHSAATLLFNAERYSDVIKICMKAISIDPYDEFSYYHLILALAKTKNFQAALSHYKEMNDLFFSEFGVTPSKELTSLYKEIVKTSKSVETDLNLIKEALREEHIPSGAFFCEYEVFKDIYRLNVRSAERTGQTLYVCLINAESTGEALPPKTLTPIMDKLFECIRLSLRRGDVYARYSVSQYILMLPATTYENGEMVINRIIRRFHKEKPRSPATLSYSLQPMDSLMPPSNR